MGDSEAVSRLEQLNASLVESLRQKESDFARYKELVDEYEALLESGGPKDSKILELAKKNRNQNLSIERLKTSLRQANAELKFVKERLAVLEGSGAPAVSTSRSSRTAPAPSVEDGASAAEKLTELAQELREYREKYNKLNTRSQELRVANQQMKADLTKYRQALQREVGDEVPLPQVLEEGSGWRGRAQKITILKAKVRSLQETLRAHQLHSEVGSMVSGVTGVSSIGGAGLDGTSMSSSATSRTGTSSLRSAVDVERERIADIASTRRQTTEELRSALQGKEDELRDMEGKVRAHKARNRILEKSLAELQSKIQVLVEKTKTDDELIEALTAELKKSRDAKRAELTNSGLRSGNEQSLNRLQQQLRDKDKIIDGLQEELELLQDTLSQASGAQGSKDCAVDVRAAALQIEVDRLRSRNMELQRQCDESLLRTSVSSGFTAPGRVTINREQPREELEAALQLQLTENSELKATLRAVNQRKAEEIQMHVDLLQEQKAMFTEQLRKARSAPSRDELVVALTDANRQLQVEIEGLKQQLAQHSPSE